MKDEYKELRKKLKDSFTNIKHTNGYGVVNGVGEWVKQSGIKPTKVHLKIIVLIFGTIPYPYQAKDRHIVIEYLKEHKYKEFKKRFIL